MFVAVHFLSSRPAKIIFAVAGLRELKAAHFYSRREEASYKTGTGPHGGKTDWTHRLGRKDSLLLAHYSKSRLSVRIIYYSIVSTK